MVAQATTKILLVEYWDDQHVAMFFGKVNSIVRIILGIPFLGFIFERGAVNQHQDFRILWDSRRHVSVERPKHFFTLGQPAQFDGDWHLCRN